MTSYISVAFLAVAIAGTPSVLAGEPRSDQENIAFSSYQQCSEQAENLRDLEDCGIRYVDAAKGELARLLERLSLEQSQPVIDRLEREQETWLSYLTSSCTYFQDPIEFGREGGAVHFPLCRAGIIQNRIAHLRTLFQRKAE